MVLRSISVSCKLPETGLTELYRFNVMISPAFIPKDCEHNRGRRPRARKLHTLVRSSLSHTSAVLSAHETIPGLGAFTFLHCLVSLSASLSLPASPSVAPLLVEELLLFWSMSASLAPDAMRLAASCAAALLLRFATGPPSCGCMLASMTQDTAIYHTESCSKPGCGLANYCSPWQKCGGTYSSKDSTMNSIYCKGCTELAHFELNFKWYYALLDLMVFLCVIAPCEKTPPHLNTDAACLQVRIWSLPARPLPHLHAEISHVVLHRIIVPYDSHRTMFNILRATTLKKKHHLCACNRPKRLSDSKMLDRHSFYL
jgi:hypothetical protein